MQKAELTTRAVAGFIDLLLVIGMSRLPDVMGFLAVTGYILVRDGLFHAQSVGKKVVGLHVAFTDDPGKAGSFRESIIRNVPLAVAYLLFLVPYAGWLRSRPLKRRPRKFRRQTYVGTILPRSTHLKNNSNDPRIF
jgi:uncharacterized RDD family membrane protein YckC